LPALRPVSASGRAQTGEKRNNVNQVQIIEPQERPPLPKNRALRG